MKNTRFSKILALAVLLAGCATAPPPETSVKPGINEGYLDPELEIDEWVNRFEVESREIYTARVAIADAAGVALGADMADVGAGTGLFLELFAERVGSSGTVYAVDISPRFVEHLTERVRAGGLDAVEVRLCSERSVELPEGSIDLAFLCDVYHHVEFPRSTMGSIHAALRPGGELVVVDFERIPGVSREWILDHVRAGKDVVIAELESFGFELVEEVAIPGLEENYFTRFRRL